MGNSTLDPENDFDVDRKLGKGHGANALGPSSSSDSGSDVSGFFDEDNDTDAGGTGERATVDVMQARFDRQETGVDRIERVGPDDDEDGYEDEDESDLVDEITRRI